MFQAMNLKQELDQALENGTWPDYMARAAGETQLCIFAEDHGWDREKVIQYCLNGESGWLGRKVFERAFDNGSMRSMAETYREFFLEVCNGV